MFDVGSVVTLKSMPEGRMTVNAVHAPGTTDVPGVSQSQIAYTCVWCNLSGGYEYGLFAEGALQTAVLPKNSDETK